MAKKNNTIWKYSIILVILILLLVLVSLKNKKYEQKIEPIFSTDPTAITSFTISKGNNKVTLLKNDSLWTFQEPDTGVVDQKKVKNMLEKVLYTKRTGFVTSNPEKYSKFNIDSNAVKFELFIAGKKSDELLIGRSKSSWANDYVKYPNDPKVYISGEKLLYSIKETPDFWRKK